MFADLHLHSNFSDGTYSPEEVVSQAVLQRLAAIALTDHDTVEGCDRAAAACGAAGVEFLSGTELTPSRTGTKSISWVTSSIPKTRAALGNRQVPGRPAKSHPRDGRAIERAGCAAAG